MVKNREFLKNYNWNIRRTPHKTHMHDMVTTDRIVFEIVGGGGGEGIVHTFQVIRIDYIPSV